MHIAQGELCRKAVPSKGQHPGTKQVRSKWPLQISSKLFATGLFSWGWCELQLLLLMRVTDAVAVGQPPENLIWNGEHDIWAYLISCILDNYLIIEYCSSFAFPVWRFVWIIVMQLICMWLIVLFLQCTPRGLAPSEPLPSLCPWLSSLPLPRSSPWCAARSSKVGACTRCSALTDVHL